MLKSFAPIQVACLALGLSFLSTALAHGAVVDFASPHATYTTGTGPRSVAIGTLNADTRPDMVVCNGTSNSISVFLQDAVTDGAFGAKTDFATLPNPASVAIVDLNGDGKGDIVVACQSSSGGFCVFLGNGTGTFPTRVDYPTTNYPQAMRVADVDGDNKLDVLGGGSPDIAFLKGVGDGAFLAPTYITTGSSVSSVAVGDLNGDNKLDIAVASSPFVQILFGNGDGSFAAPVSYSNGLYVLSIGVGNFTADSLPDVVVSNYNDSSLSIFPNQGGGVFGPHQEFATGLSPKSLQPVDLDGDGNLDVVMVDVGLAAVGYLRGKGDGTFYPHIAYTTGSGPYVDAVGDLTGDGKPDVVAANQNAASVSVLIQGTGVAPATISTLATTQVADRSVTLTWTAPMIESFEATAYDVRYSTSPITAGNFAAATQASGEPAPFIAGSLVTFAVEGLSPSTLYYFAEQTHDAFGRSSGVSNVVSAMTAGADTIPPAAVTSLLSTYYLFDTSVVVRWTAPGDDGRVGTATAYDLRMSTAVINAGNFSAATVVTTSAPLPAGSLESVLVTGLAPGATYYFALMTRDEVPLWSALSNLPSITTNGADSTAPATILTLVASLPTTTGVTLTWTAPGDDSSYGTATSYDLRYSPAPITTLTQFNAATAATGVPAPHAANTVETFAVTGLSPGTRYYFAIRTADEVPNLSALSLVVSAMTTTAGGSGNSSSNSGGCGIGSGLATLWLLTLGTLIALRASGSRSQRFI